MNQVLLAVLLDSNDFPPTDFLPLPGVPKVAKAPKAQAPNKIKKVNFLSERVDM